MSDHDHDEGPKGHEIDNMPSRKLFNLLFGLLALTILACIGVVQLFFRQVESIETTRYSKTPFHLAEYREEMDALTKDWNVTTIDDDDGVASDKGGKGAHEAKRYRMPMAEARKRVLESPEKYLKAQRAYRNWPNPDPNAPKVQRRQRPTRPVAPRGAAPAKPRIVPTRAVPSRGAQPAAPTQAPAPAAPGPKGNEGKAAPKPGTPANEGKAPN